MIKDTQAIQVLQAGLRAASMRQSAIANNIANLETPGYRRHAVRFEEMLADALDGSGAAELAEVRPELFRPMDTPVNASGNDVSMDAEIGDLMRNTGRYKTYMRLLSRLYRQIELAAQ
jgi:flagellar basal-body rod protein FlgB